MKNNRSVYIIIAITILLVFGGIYMYLNSNKTKYDWNANYTSTSDQPFDLKYLFELLKESRPNRKFHEVGSNLYQYLEKHKSQQPSNLIHIGNYYNLDDSNAQLIIQYISEGNNVYIASTQKPAAIINQIFCRDILEEKGEFYYPSETKTDIKEFENTFYNSDLKYKKNLSDIFSFQSIHNDSIQTQFNYKPFQLGQGFYFRYFYIYDYENRDWNYIDTSYINYFGLCDTNRYTTFDVLETMNQEYPGLLRINIGKGSLYIHPNPILFTNYFMIEKKGYDYASRCFSYLNSGDIHWDNISNRTLEKIDPDKLENHSPLKFFLGQQALRWAWYTFLILLILFGLFRSKRQQRIIPVLPRKDNDSKEYYATVSRLYFLNQDHTRLARIMQRHFGLFVRRKFLFNIYNPPENSIELLAKKTQLGETYIKSIFEEFKKLDADTVFSESDLIELYLKLQKFYQSCH